MAVARRTKQTQHLVFGFITAKETVIIVGFLLAFFYFAQHQSLMQHSVSIGVRLAISLAIGSCAVLWIKRRHLEHRLHREMSVHRADLISSYLRGRRQQYFGAVDETLWDRYRDDFLRDRVYIKRDFARWRASRSGKTAAAKVLLFTEGQVQTAKRADPLSMTNAEEVTPAAYERLCGDLFTAAGWQVRMTPHTRDSGADVIVDLGEHRLVIQCKRYSKPVGNRAVQEVYTALSLYHGTASVVIAPNHFTAQALREAHGLGVHLLHHSSISAFATQLAQASGRRRSA